METSHNITKTSQHNGNKSQHNGNKSQHNGNKSQHNGNKSQHNENKSQHNGNKPQHNKISTKQWKQVATRAAQYLIHRDVDHWQATQFALRIADESHAIVNVILHSLSVIYGSVY